MVSVGDDPASLNDRKAYTSPIIGMGEVRLKVIVHVSCSRRPTCKEFGIFSTCASNLRNSAIAKAENLNRAIRIGGVDVNNDRLTQGLLRKQG